MHGLAKMALGKTVPQKRTWFRDIVSNKSRTRVRHVRHRARHVHENRDTILQRLPNPRKYHIYKMNRPSNLRKASLPSSTTMLFLLLVRVVSLKRLPKSFTTTSAQNAAQSRKATRPHTQHRRHFPHAKLPPKVEFAQSPEKYLGCPQKLPSFHSLARCMDFNSIELPATPMNSPASSHTPPASRRMLKITLSDTPGKHH